MSLNVGPPLVAADDLLDFFVDAVREVVQLADSQGAFWSDALGLARCAFRS